MASFFSALLNRLVALVVIAFITSSSLTFAAGTKVRQAVKKPDPVPPAPEKDAQTYLVVPDVSRQTYVFAKGMLEDAGFAWRVEGSVEGYAANVVAAQVPAGGTRVLDTGSPEIVVRLARNPEYAESGSPQNTSPYEGTPLVLAPGERPEKAFPKGKRGVRKGSGVKPKPTALPDGPAQATLEPAAAHPPAAPAAPKLADAGRKAAKPAAVSPAGPAPVTASPTVAPLVRPAPKSTADPAAVSPAAPAPVTASPTVAPLAWLALQPVANPAAVWPAAPAPVTATPTVAPLAWLALQPVANPAAVWPAAPAPVTASPTVAPLARAAVRPAAKPSATRRAKPAEKAESSTYRSPDFVVAGVPREPKAEMPLTARARMIGRRLAAESQPSQELVDWWLYQHAWVVTGAKFGWKDGDRALRILIKVDEDLYARFGFGLKSAAVARDALQFVESRKGV